MFAGISESRARFCAALSSFSVLPISDQKSPEVDHSKSKSNCEIIDFLVTTIIRNDGDLIPPIV